jgi:hypothetical protein
MIKQICFKVLIAIVLLIWVIPFLSAAAVGFFFIGLVWVKNQIESLFDRAFVTSVE